MINRDATAGQVDHHLMKANSVNEMGRRMADLAFLHGCMRT